MYFGNPQWNKPIKLSLKELIALQPITGESDLEIIRRWFVENEQESAGLSLIPTLAESQANRLENSLNFARTWADSVPTQQFYKDYDPHTAQMLEHIIMSYIVSQEVYERYHDWCAEHFPQMDTPKVIFQPAIEWIAKEWGIRFRDYREN